MASTIEYDPQTGTLHCPGCRQPMNVKRYAPGRRVMCPRCQNVMRVPDAVAQATAEAREEATPAAHAEEAPPPSPPSAPATPPDRPIYDPDKKVLTCPKCNSQYRVAGYNPGRKLMCVSCESILVVPGDQAPRREPRSAAPAAPKLPSPRLSPAPLAAPPIPPPSPPPTPPKAERPEPPPETPPAVEERKQAPPPPARGEKKEATERKPRPEVSEPSESPPAKKAKTERTRRPTAAVQKPPPPAPEEEPPKPDEEPPAPDDELPEQEDLDELDSSSAEAPPGAKRLLTCNSCEAIYNVTGIEIGRKILCLRCETMMEVRDDLPVVSEADMVDLQVIDLGPVAPARELTSTKKAFRDFYEKETKRRRRPLTERTVRVSVAELRDMVDQDPNYQDRPGVAESVARSAMLTPRRGKRGTGKRNPIGLFLGIGGGAIAVAAVAAFLVFRSDLAKGREEEKADQESEVSPSNQGPRSAGEVLPLGRTVVFHGLVPGDAEIFAAPPVVGTTLVNRDRIQVWIQDEDLARQALFQKILDQRNQPDGGRICLKVTARVRAVTPETPIPAGASDKVYLAVIDIEELGFDDWQAMEQQIEVKAQE